MHEGELRHGGSTMRMKSPAALPSFPLRKTLWPHWHRYPLWPRSRHVDCMDGLLTWVWGSQVSQVGSQSFRQLRNLGGCQGSLPASAQGCEDAFGRVIHTKGAKGRGARVSVQWRSE